MQNRPQEKTRLTRHPEVVGRRRRDDDVERRRHVRADGDRQQVERRRDGAHALSLWLCGRG